LGIEDPDSIKNRCSFGIAVKFPAVVAFKRLCIAKPIGIYTSWYVGCSYWQH